MVEISGDIQGLDDLARNINKLKPSFQRSTLRTGLRNAAAPVRKRARAGAAKRTGKLRRNIKSKAKVFRSGYGQADIGVTDDAFYGRIIETGSSQQQARPFLRPAFHAARAAGEIHRGFIEAINKTIQRQLGRFGG